MPAGLYLILNNNLKNSNKNFKIYYNVKTNSAATEKATRVVCST